MNAKQLLLLMLVCFYSSLIAQKLVSPENRWYYRFQGPNYMAFFKDSTLINGQYYFPLYTTTDSNLQKIEPSRYFFRQEQQRVYRLQANDLTSPEMLVYDFNFKVGDSIVFSSNNIIKVYKVDTVTLNDGSKRKRWTFYLDGLKLPVGGNMLRYCIEGVGFVGASGPFYTPERMYITIAQPGLSCFLQKDTYLYGSGVSCTVKIGINEGTSAKTLPTIPSIELLKHTPDGQVLYNLQEPGRYRYHLYNSQGALLASGIASQGNNELSLAFWPRGMYVLQILDEEHWRQKTYKLVRQ
jgi:hypothetical protein